jgi:hypothetical protein
MILARSLQVSSSPNEALVALQYRIRSIRPHATRL